jgi:hypothetical protein
LETCRSTGKMAAFGLDPQIRRVPPRMEQLRPSQSSDVNLLGDRERVIDLDAKIAHV